MHLPHRAPAILCVLFFAANAAVAQVNLLGNPGFESGTVFQYLPTTAGSWGADLNYAVAAENGITPRSGSKMLHFVNMAVDGIDVGTGSDSVQLVDLSGYASAVSAGNFTTTFSAYFNRVTGSSDDRFALDIRAYSGALANFPAVAASWITRSTADLFSDSNASTWEPLSLSFVVPTNASYLALWVTAMSGSNVVSLPGGHYADDISLTAIPEPATYAAILGLGCLGGACYARRRGTTPLV